MSTARKIVLAALLAAAGCSSWTESDQPYLRTTKNLIPGKAIIADHKQTAYVLAKRYNVAMDDLIILNRMRAPYVVWPGQEVTLPATATEPNLMIASGGVTNEGLMAPAQPGWSGGGAGGSFGGGMGSGSVSVSELPPPPSTVQFARQPSAAALPSPMQTGKFIWPVDGPVLSDFGPKTAGGMNDGLNIAAPRGAAVVAAANGIVVHAGNDMKSFGNLVLIRHGEGYVTAYAHLDRMMVDKDSVIAKGDMIGAVGSTGDVRGPQLHFEIRLNGKPIDPMPLLPRRETVTQVGY